MPATITTYEHRFPLETVLKVLLGLALLSFGLCGITGEYYWLLTPFIVLIGLLPFYNFRWFFWLFILSVPLSVHKELPGSLTLTLPNEPLMAGLLFLLLFLLIYNNKAIPAWFWDNAITLIIILQLFWTVISVIFAQELLFSVKFLLAKLWYLSSFFFIPALVIRNKKDIKKVFLLFCIPVILHSFFAFAWHAYTGFGYYESNLVVRPFYQNHVDYGSILSMTFPVVMMAYAVFKGKYRWTLLFLLLFLVAAIYFASSRAAILAVIFAVVVMFAMKKKWVNWILPSIYVFIIVIISLLAYNDKFLEFRPNKSYNATQDTFLETVTGAFTGKDMSSMERFYRWIASVRMVEDHPIVGVGPNNWYYHYKPHAVRSFSTWVSRNPERSTTHNYFLLMVTEQGIPAMLLYAVLMVVLFAKAQQTYHRFTDHRYKQYTLLVAMIIAASFVNNFFSELLETHKVGGLFFLSVSILVFLEFKSKESNLKQLKEKIKPVK